MNKNDLKDIKLFIGPMSKNIVDGAIEFCDKFNVRLGFIPSRRQIDFDSGYVNNWITRTFSEYVKSKTNKIVLERDHGGPLQGQDIDDGNASFFQDTNYLDIIHIDVWKKYKDFQNGLNKTIECIKFCSYMNPNILFEIGTEEAIRKTNTFELEYLLFELKRELNEELFNKIAYCVIQSGTSLKGTINTGKYNPIKLRDMCHIVNKYGILSKEHNSDFVDIEEIYDRYDGGLNALNIAPEFGQIETNCILKLINNDDNLFNKYYNLCFNSNHWVK